MLASQTLNKDIAKEVVGIRVIADNAYREVLSIHPILKKNASTIESFTERLNEFSFLSSLEEKFKLLSVSLDNKISSFSSKVDNFFAEISRIKNLLDEERKKIGFLKEEFLSLYQSFNSFKKAMEHTISVYVAKLEQRIESSKKEEEKLRADIEKIFCIKRDENNQKNKELLFKIEASEENSRVLLEEIRRLKVSIRVLENNFATFRNKEKG